MKKDTPVLPTKLCEEAERFYPNPAVGLSEAQVIQRQDE